MAWLRSTFARVAARYCCAAESMRSRSATGGVRLRSNDREFTFDYAISAIPFHALGRILPQSAASEELQQKVGHLRTVPITGIHLWFDREITELEHAALLDRNIQWMFQKSKILTRHTAARERSGSYLELVVSSSKNLLEMGRAEIIELAMKELAEFFPAVRDAKLVKATVIKEVHATLLRRLSAMSFARRRQVRGHGYFSAATGPRRAGLPPWKARCERDISRQKLFPKLPEMRSDSLFRT